MEHSAHFANIPHRYGNLRAIWDHIMLPFDRQRWHHAFTPANYSWYLI